MATISYPYPLDDKKEIFKPLAEEWAKIEEAYRVTRERYSSMATKLNSEYSTQQRELAKQLTYKTGIELVEVRRDSWNSKNTDKDTWFIFVKELELESVPKGYVLTDEDQKKINSYPFNFYGGVLVLSNNHVGTTHSNLINYTGTEFTQEEIDAVKRFEVPEKLLRPKQLS